MAAFFQLNFNLKNIENMIFPAFGRIFVLVTASSVFHKSIEQLIFQSIGRILVLVAAFFFSQIAIEKVLKT